ncbi:MAG: DUF5688 family protein [Anaerocolumna sp.]
MHYEQFKEVVATKILDYMPKEYHGGKVDIRPVTKVNQILDGLTIYTRDKVGIPTLYINHLYEDFKECNDLEKVLKEAACAFNKAYQEAPNIGADFNTAKDNIVFQLINTAQNKEMLLNTPNRAFQDLSLIYRWVVKSDIDGIQSTVVGNELAERLGFTEEQMFKFAVENTRRMFPPTVKSMNDAIRDIFIKDGMPEEIADMMIGEMPPEQTMWIISNERGINGAISMLYEDKLHGLAENLGTDLYIMPSSLHEVIAVSVSMGDPNELAQMVAKINMDQVELGERLSNQLYYYDKDLRRISMATDTPNKSLRL